MPGYVCCPDCKGMLDVRRVGPAGVRGVDDSDTFYCESCGITFRDSGETWKEAHGAISE